MERPLATLVALGTLSTIVIACGGSVEPAAKGTPCSSCEAMPSVAIVCTNGKSYVAQCVSAGDGTCEAKLPECPEGTQQGYPPRTPVPKGAACTTCASDGLPKPSTVQRCADGKLLGAECQGLADGTCGYVIPDCPAASDAGLSPDGSLASPDAAPPDAG